MKKLIIFSVLTFLCSQNCYAIRSFISPDNIGEIEGSPIWSIVQDNDDFIWIATHSGVYRYDGYKLLNTPLEINSKLNFGTRVNSLIVDKNGIIWAGTNNNGIFYLKSGYFHEFKLESRHKQLKIKSIIESDSQLLFATTNGIINLSSKPSDFNSQTYDFIPPPENTLINSIALYHDNTILVGTNDGVHQLNINNNKYFPKLFSEKLKGEVIQSFLFQFNNILWIGTNSGMFKVVDTNNIEKVITNHRVQSIISDGNIIWAGTIYDGLIRYEPSTNKFELFQSDLSQTISLADNTIYTLLIDNKNILWVGTFHNGISILNLNTFEFKLNNHSTKSISCSKSKVFSSQLIENNIWWLGTEKGLIKFDKKTNDCSIIISDPKDPSTLSHNMVTSLNKGIGDQLWVSTGTSLNLVSTSTLTVNRLVNQVPQATTLFSTEINSTERLIGTSKGLYKINQERTEIHKLLFVNKKNENIYFYDVKKNSNGEYFFGTSTGLVKLNKNGFLEEFATKVLPFNKFDIFSFLINDDDTFWVGVGKYGLYHLTSNGELISIVKDELNFSKSSFIYSMEKDAANKLWLGSEIGLFRFDPITNESSLFNKSNGLQSSSFIHKSSFKTPDGELFFGGRHGFNNFNPEKLILTNNTPNVVLTSFSYFNKTLNQWGSNNDTFKLDKPINELDQIDLSYKDYIIGFEFAALDYADPMRNQYAYRLKGFADDWVYTDAKDRKATYTNLSPGDYTFQVKASNKDGIWSDTPKELRIKVNPAPWFSPWAFFAYFIITVFSIWAFIRYKTIASRKRAEHLEITVEHRTQEVNRQKKVVESLLDHKNEVFANVTHEFNTPIALILGPTDQLENKPELAQYSEELNMIQRNARRLMLMVGQILKLSQAELNKEVIRESQALSPILTMLYESFKPLANNKQIELFLENNHEVNVYATSDCLEIVIGNLLSNALKYTNTGGLINIKSTLKDKYVSVHVSDTGSGIHAHDLNKIFTRFTRLDSHKSIQGTGIGLSVVKEITQANDGHVTVNSELGKGSEFIVTFPITEIDANLELSQDLVDQLVSNTDNEIAAEKTATTNDSKIDKNKITVLIIEDNLDMQTHIGNVLKARFNCLFADRGKKGIALALKEVPDIVICDVMMPGMDGYQVTRILRHDGRTSHIPIILLTALNNKESRIKGWRENIDVYVTKPFDATELNVQIDNILTIRKILQKKTNKAIKTNDSLSNLDLPEQDLKFIEKLKDVIGLHYVNEYFQKADIASKMAVSERQLQRKVKALIDENPMDMLRDYRLNQAALKLKTGKQVGIVSDECGFSAVAYFSTCFKKKYGVTPKQYQTLNKR